VPEKNERLQARAHVCVYIYMYDTRRKNDTRAGFNFGSIEMERIFPKFVTRVSRIECSEIEKTVSSRR